MNDATTLHRSAKESTVNAEATRIRRFERRVAFCSSGGKFCDGWILAVIGVALPLASTGLNLSPLWESLIGSASLIGLFFGGLIFGWVTDQIGRKKMFLFTLATFLICSALQFFVSDGAQLFVLRLVMGLAVGADYAIAGSMIAEFTSKRRRGPYLAGMIVWWYGGFSIAATLALIFVHMNDNQTDAWRWILASACVPALVMLLARLGMPESPRWLAGRGRTEEARRIADHYLDPETRADVFKEEPAQTGYAALFSSQYIRKTALCSIFWMAQVTPFFAIYTFLPNVLDSMNLDINNDWGQVILYAFLFVGSACGAAVVNKVGRRRLLIWPFVITAASLLVLGIWPSAPGPVVIICFVVFAFFNAASGVLEMLYPSELFPTDIRATGVGFAASMSRIGAAIGTFLLPIGLTALGVGPVMLISAGILIIGLIVSVMWAPETTDLELSQTTGVITTVAH